MIGSGTLNVNSDPKQKKENAKAHKERSNQRHKQLFENVFRAFRRSYFVPFKYLITVMIKFDLKAVQFLKFLHDEPGSEKETNCQKENCELWVDGRIDRTNVPTHVLNDRT